MNGSNLPVECEACGDQHMEADRPFVRQDADTDLSVCPKCQHRTYLYEEQPLQIGPLDV